MVLSDAQDAVAAYEGLQRELRKVRSGESTSTPRKIRFSDYAVSLLERKVRAGDIKSAATRGTWDYILRLHLLPKFGDFFVDEIRRSDVLGWRNDVACEIKAGKCAPTTANDWRSVLVVVMNSAVDEFELERNPVAGLKMFDTSEHAPYTEEEPNSLTPPEVPTFLAGLRTAYARHFAFAALGFGTGLRPSSIRPLRRKGPTPDVLWDEGAILVRRSHSRRQEVMETTKTGIRQKITLPDEMMEILRWHVARIPEGPELESDLLFPGTNGRLRATSCLDKPFREMAKAMNLKKTITPRAMRRTFQDLARAAEVRDIVTRAVSGHATESMQRHYSTVHPDEIRQGLARVVSIAGFREALDRCAGERVA
jgi:integrase